MNLPNKLTLLRILLAPLFVVVFFIDNLYAKIGAFVIAGLIELTDLFDGIIARRKNKVTTFGKLFDPLADKLSRLTIFICFAAYNTSGSSYIAPVWRITNAHLIPAWMVIIVVARDMIVSMLRTLAASQKIIMAAKESGKIKAIVQAIGILSILLLLIVNEFIALPINIISYFLMLIVVIITAWSGFDYMLKSREILSRLRL